MKIRIWSGDTIARRFALTIGMAAVGTLMLVGLFLTAGGNWARPSLEHTELPGLLAGISRVVNAAPPAMRPSLVKAVAYEKIVIDYYEPTSRIAAGLEAAKEAGQVHVLPDLVGDRYPAILVFDMDCGLAIVSQFDYDHVKYPEVYFLAVKFTDGGWLVFTSLGKQWGLSNAQHLAILFGFLVFSIIVVSVVAARQLSKPIKRLAEAVHFFGLNPQAPAIDLDGPHEIRQVIQSFNAMQAKIQDFIGYRTTMLAAISHDLRTPLTRIRLRGEFIEDPEQQARLFRDVDEMQTMVDGALAFFRDDASDEDPTDLDLPGVLRTIANDYADQNIELNYHGPAHAVYRGRPFALKRAFGNLIENAIKYAAVPEIELSCTATEIVVVISDRGPGIPEEDIAAVFKPFHRLDRSRNRRTGGVGLGLTSAQAIIRAHGGEIALINRTGGGLEARVTLPIVLQTELME